MDVGQQVAVADALDAGGVERGANARAGQRRELAFAGIVGGTPTAGFVVDHRRVAVDLADARRQLAQDGEQIILGDVTGLVQAEHAVRMAQAGSRETRQRPS